MDGDRRQRSVEALVVERQGLGDPIDCWREVGRTLASHRRRRLDWRDLEITRFIRTSPCTDVHERLHVPQGPSDGIGEHRLRLANRRVVDVASLVVEVARGRLAHGQIVGAASSGCS